MAGAMEITVGAMDTMVKTAGIMATTADTMENIGTMATTADTVDTIGMTGMDITVARGGRGSSVLVGVIRGMGIRIMGILTAPTTIATMAIRMEVTTAAITPALTTGMAMPPVQE